MSWVTFSLVQNADVSGVLGPIGFNAAEEAAYRYLVGRPQATVDQVAAGAGLDPVAAVAALDGLHERRLVERSTADPSLHQAVRPDEAFEPLLRDRQHEVDSARTAVERLLAEFRAVPRGGSVADILEIVEGRSAADRRFGQLYDSTRRSNESFVKPPLLVRGVETEHEPFRSSVSYKVVYDPAALSLPGMVPVVAEDIEGGEQARTCAVPLKMALFDRERAFLPISPWRAGSEPVAMIVHGSALADALGALFDAVWAQASPLRLSADGLEEDPNRPAADDLLLLELLRAGLTDEAIARQTGTSVRTVGRRVRHLMDLTGTGTRFQLGVRALERGWF